VEYTDDTVKITELFIARTLLKDQGCLQNKNQSVSQRPYADWNRNVFSWQRKALVDFSSFIIQQGNCKHHTLPLVLTPGE